MNKLNGAGPAAALAALLLSGCGAPGDERLDLRIPDEPRKSIREEYRAYRSGDANLNNMSERLIASCMKDQGFDYVPEIIESDRPVTVEDTFSLSISDAHDSGYTGFQRSVSDIADAGDAENPGRNGLSADDSVAWDKAYSGVENQRKTVRGALPGQNSSDSSELTLGGCSLQAGEDLYGSLEALEQSQFADSNLGIFALNSAAGSSDLIDLNSAWSQCMDKSGWGEAKVGDTLAAPEDAQSVAGEYAEWEPGLSLADATCQQQLDYSATRTRVEDRYLTAVADFYESEITAALDIKRQAQDRGSALGL